MTLIPDRIKFLIKKKLPVNEVLHALSTLNRISRKSDNDFFSNQFLDETLWVYKADKTSITWYDKKWDSNSRTEFAELREREIPRDGLIFDIGAHQGIVSILLRRILVPQGLVVAVEMDGVNHRACTKNFLKNQETSIVNVRAAVSAEAGYVRFSGRSNSEIIAGARLPFILPKIEAITLDDMCDKYGIPDLVYLDIEGAEILAFQGAKKSLGRVRNWFIELHGDTQCAKFGGINRDVFDALKRNGYKIKHSPAEDEPFCMTDESFNTSERGFLIAYL